MPVCGHNKLRLVLVIIGGLVGEALQEDNIGFSKYGDKIT
jgi:hypothetical protein